MRLSQFPIFTTKETPADAEIVSHQLMLRTGMIRRVAAGLYSWMPLGLRVLHKVSTIVREEMNRAGCVEMLMPSIQPVELWQESGRINAYGRELLRIQDRHDRDFCYGPTHEEVVTSHFRQEFHSYRQLPINLYQIQTKFRDEIRPRFGVMRAREFLMKDGYSFHMDEAGLDEGYQRMRSAYSRVFERCGLEYRIVVADAGQIGGSGSEEFHVLAEAGEDLLAVSSEGSYAANVEAAVCSAPAASRSAPGAAMEKVETPTQKTIAELSDFLGVAPSQCLKTLLVVGSDGHPVVLLLRGDHELNEIKAEKHPLIAEPLQMASDAQIEQVFGAPAGFIGPVGINAPIVADHAALAMADFVCGANQNGWHLQQVNWERDLPLPQAADLRIIAAGDPSPDGKGTVSLVRGIEVGHIFKLGDKYSKAMNVTVLDEGGKSHTPIMGTYGIGVSRIVGAAIEQHNDDKGICWPTPLAPFTLALLPINPGKSERVRETTEQLYTALLERGIDVVIDDRGLRPGVMFADIELIGIPHRVVIGDRGLEAGTLEYKARRDAESRDIDNSLEAILDAIS